MALSIAVIATACTSSATWAADVGPIDETAVAVPVDPVPESAYDTWTVQGALSGQLRGYLQEPLYTGESNYLFPVLAGWLSLSNQWNGGTDRIKIKGVGRWDPLDGRDLLDIPEAYYLHNAGTWDLLAGISVVYWGITESNNVVNIINQRDLGGSFNDNSARLGQPMINYNLVSGDYGTFSVFALFGFRQPDFPSGLPINDDAAIYDASNFERDVNFAARYANMVQFGAGDFDYALSYFHGLSREPRFVPGPAGTFLPAYDAIDQIGGEFLYAQGSLQLKSEMIYNMGGGGGDFFATVSGLEYTISGAFGGRSDLGLIGEVNYDDRSPFAPPTIFDNDLFGGVRVAFNDERETKLIAGYMHDWDDQSSYTLFEIETRLRDSVTAELEGRIFNGFAPGPFGVSLDADSYIEGRITVYF